MAPPKKTTVAAPPVVAAPVEPPLPTSEAVDAEAALAEETAETATSDSPAAEEIVAVGTVSHVIRRAFHHFYTEVESHRAPLEAFTSEESPVADAATAVATEVSESQPPDATDATSVTETVVHPYVALGATRKQLLHESLALTQSTASALLTFLDERYSAAAVRDEAVAADLARQGLVVRAQIPLGPSHLQLDPHELAPFGPFAATLVHAKTLVRDYHNERLDKSGNGPTFLAHKVAAIAHAPPGYLRTTSSSNVRTETTLAVHEHHIHTVKGVSGKAETRSDTIAETPAAESSVCFGTKDNEMPAAEKRKNLEILERMQTKLDFLRNPRYAMHAALDNDDGDAAAAPPPSFVAVPSPVVFTDYDSGGVYEQTFFVRNHSNVSRRVRVLPPATIYFSVAQIAFPDASGLVAPGMHVQVKLRFAPDSRADYKDTVLIQYESSGGGGGSGNNKNTNQEISLPVIARRTPPALSIPLQLRAQPTLVGSQSVTTLPCKNTGGRARFWLMSERDWARCEAASAFRAGGAIASVLREFQTQGGLRVGPFTLSPSDMELATGESVLLQLTFLPSGVGEMRDKFVMVCDNCLVRVFQLVGRGCQVDVSVSALNDHAIDRSIASMGRVAQLVFAKALLLNATATQQFTILNDTPIDLPFTWRLETATDNATVDVDAETCPFRISPATGILPQSDTAAFTVAFTPPSARRYSLWRLVLLINDVPACSIPGPHQLRLLSETFERLRDAQQHQRLGDGLVKLTAAEAAVECMRVSLHGAGRLGDFHLDPAVANVVADPRTAEVQLGETCNVTTRVWNDCDAAIVVQWDPSRARCLCTQAGAGARGPILFELSIDAVEMTIAARSHTDVTVAFTPRAVGRFAVALPCAIVDPHASARASVERWLRLEGTVAQPQLCIASPEIDFGLVLASASADAMLTIRNNAHCATGDWMLVHLEASATLLATSEDASPSPLSSLRRSSSKDSLCSRTSSSAHSTARSSTGSLALFSARDLAPRAIVSFSPATGTLAPGEAVDVRVTCQSGSLPERFRGTIAVRPVPSSLPPVFPYAPPLLSSSVSARAEIQSPNVFLTPLRLSLGSTFLDVGVEREVHLINVSNLAADFKFVEPQGASRACTIECSPKQGVLLSKQTLAVRIRYTPRQAGKTTTLLACSVKGLAGPLGLEIVSTHKGLVLTYDVLPLDKEEATMPLAPTALANLRGMSVDDGDLEPDGNAHALPKLLFGDAIPLAQRRTLRLVIRNFSGIDAQLELEPKRFAAATIVEAPSTSTTTNGSLRSRASRSGLSSRDDSNSSDSLGFTPTTAKRKTKTKPSLLSDANDTARRFQSNAGRAFIQAHDHAQQDRALLCEGHGVAFLVSSPTRLEPLVSLRIAPWAATVVHVTCVHNMPGVYSDVLSCRAVGVPPVLLPMHATVVGTPLVLDTNTVGLHVPTSQLKNATFSFGHVCIRSPAVTKTLRLINRGPRAASLAWRLVDPAREHQRVQLSLRVNGGARVRVRIASLDVETMEQLPFEMVPTQSRIAPFASVAVSITFFPTDHATAARALLIGDAHWLDDAMPSASSRATMDRRDHTSLPTADLALDPRCETASAAALSSPRLATAAGKAIQAVRVANSLARSHSPVHPASSIASAQCIRVLLRGAVVEPELFLDAPQPRPSAPYDIRFTTWSTLLASPDDAAWRHAFHRREFSLVNHLNARLTFRLEATGPFAVTRAESLAPRHPLATADLPAAHRRADGESFLFTLPPHMAVRVELQVDPTKLQAAATPSTNTLSRRIDGELLVRFTNQCVQTLRLACEVRRPQLVASPSVYNFGRVYLSQTRSLVLRVANPTRVPAAFSVCPVPRPTPLSRAQKHEVATHHAQWVDDPSVFRFGVDRGVIQGPTISLRSAGATPQPATLSTRDLDREKKEIVFAALEIPVTFAPRAIGTHYKSRFRLCVDNGVSCEVVLEGRGHLDEVDYHDQDRPMVRTRELTHHNLMFRTLSPTPTIQ